MRILNSLRWLVGLVVKEYLIFDIYKYDLLGIKEPPSVPAPYKLSQLESTDEILISEDTDLRKCHSAINADSRGFGIWKNNLLLGVCWIWSGEYYKKKRNFLPLKSDEAELVFLSVAKSARGEGLAKLLIQHASYYTKQNQYNKIYARIWHSNTPSIRSFQNAGWFKHSKVIQIHVKGISKPLRFTKIFSQ
ncbi:GNAT family N-acetyltransferase [Alkalimonas collagenimarina]|uniref:GNAT family N-acetyltransferase n=1 Tax=Alkalimonas collagenimarina TaxID=400390 RepID=A0ABT9GZ78_9GAMM|nr:GNAT family N-acetyltransferase [Alkalimonas collagenimarina]MDP4536362.1 GNAT family N-acetyltransferase [Alkalimonas collagenimarina]